MSRSADRRRSPGPPSPGQEHGYTLIELLVAMAVAVIVLGSGVWLLARAFSVSNAATSRVTANADAEVSLERLVVDLRDAVNTSCFFNQASVSGVAVSLNASVTTVQMCDPNVDATTSTSVPPTEAVQWQCNTASSGTAPQTCIRSVDAGTATAPAITTSNRINGVQALTLTGLLNATTTPVNLPCDTTATCTATASQTYTLNPGSSASLSWVGLNASVNQLVPFAAGGARAISGSSPLSIRTGAALLNFGTS